MINVPVDVDKIVRDLPHQLDDDCAFNVSIKKHLIHKSTYLSGFVKKATVKHWLKYLVDTPMYQFFGIKLNEDQLREPWASTSREEDIVVELETTESWNDDKLLIGQQHTLLWNEDKCLEIAQAQNNTLLSII